MTAPSTPGGLALEPATDRIHARWFPSPDATAYRIYFSTSLPLRSCGLSVEVTETAGELGGLPIATLYHLAVSAINAQGEESALCDPVSTQTLEPPPPPPAYVAASPGENCLELVWNQVSGSTGYTVYYATESPVHSDSIRLEVVAAEPAPTQSLQIDALSNDQTYYLAVSRTCADGSQSELSVEVQSTPCAQADEAPEALA